MASPFAIFRKNQKAMYALLAIMCMVGFSIGGALDYTSSMRSNEDPVIATAYGKAIRASEVQQLMRRKQWAITFVDRCQRAEFGLSDQLDESMTARLMQMMGKIPALLYFGEPSEENVVQTWVLSERAKQTGMVVSDAAVNKFLQDVTSNKVKSEVLAAIAKQMGVGQAQLFEALRGELLALRLREMVLGRMQTTPAQRWDYYRRQKQHATVELVPVRVEDLIGDVADPPNEDLRAFFDSHKDQEPNPDSPTPGFKVPKKAAFQVVTAKFSDFYDEQAVTDEEIQKHYEDFKDTRYLWEQYDLEGDDEPEATDESKKSDATDEKPADTRDEKASESSSDKSEDKTETKPAANDKTEKPANDPSDKPATDEKNKNSTAAPDKGSQSLVRPFKANGVIALDSRGAPARRDGRQPTVTNRLKIQQPRSGDRDNSSTTAAQLVRPLAALTGLVAADDEPADNETIADKTSTADKNPADAAQNATDTENAKKATTEKPAGKKPKSKTPAVAPPITEEYLLPRDIRKGAHPKHAPLWKVEETIRKEIAREKANQKIDDALAVIREKMRKYARQLGPDEEDVEMPELAKAATAKGLTEQDTGLLSALELREKFPDLATATGDQGGALFVQIAYSGMAKFQSTTVQDIEANRYLVWKVEEQDAYVPEFADVRSKVLRVWKIIKARDLAVKKAAELAAEADKAKKPLKDVFTDREGLTVTQTLPFSWLTRGTADADNRSPLRISEVEGVESPGPDFMRTVFSLNVGSTGEAMNEPQTIVYVVRLVSLEPSPERLRTSFFADPFPLYNEVAREDMAEIQRAWIKGVETEANLTWKDADQRRR